MSPIHQRTRFLAAVVEQLLKGTPYQWGGKGLRGDWGLDCSGLVTSAYLASGGPDWRAEHNAQRLLEVLAPPAYQVLRGGELVFYGPSPERATHVMVHMGGDLLVGACGGDSRCTSLEEAHRLDARVRTRQGLHYRADYLGTRELPWADER